MPIKEPNINRSRFQKPARRVSEVCVDAVPRGALFLLIKLSAFPQTYRACVQPGTLCETYAMEAVARVAASMGEKSFDMLLSLQLSALSSLRHADLTKTSLWVSTAWWSHWTGTTCNRALALELKPG